uniref:Uncharacterized protein n=1 Tax=Zonotrichia albicollis TaxID=44394 RepID=A0A8D2NEE8_ZONAL
MSAHALIIPFVILYQVLQNITKKTHQQKPDGLTCPQQITHLFLQQVRNRVNFKSHIKISMKTYGHLY